MEQNKWDVEMWVLVGLLLGYPEAESSLSDAGGDHGESQGK